MCGSIASLLQCVRADGRRIRLRFNERHLPNWRQVIRQVVDFLDALTVENTTSLAGSNLDWIRADGR